MNARVFNVFRDSVLDDLAVTRYSIELNLLHVLQELRHDDGILLRYARGYAEKFD